MFSPAMLLRFIAYVVISYRDARPFAMRRSSPKSNEFFELTLALCDYRIQVLMHIQA